MTLILSLVYFVFVISFKISSNMFPVYYFFIFALMTKLTFFYLFFLQKMLSERKSQVLIFMKRVILLLELWKPSSLKYFLCNWKGRKCTASQTVKVALFKGNPSFFCLPKGFIFDQNPTILRQAGIVLTHYFYGTFSLITIFL